VCAAISEKTGVEALAIQDKAFNQWEFIQFLYWIRFINGQAPLAIFMDNLSVHKTLAAQKAYIKLNIKPIFNLPYSPEYNPIELVFSQVKRIFNRERL
jgi:transposase